MTQSAQEEVWWQDFVSEYGRTPLKELARRFGTNARRLRRAAQRCGLMDESSAIRENQNLLGWAPDASVAEKLGVTTEAVKGARTRRKIPPFRPNQVFKVRTPRPVQPAVPVVVRRAPARPTPARQPGGFQTTVVPRRPLVQRPGPTSRAEDPLEHTGRKVRDEGRRMRRVPRAERPAIEQGEERKAPRTRKTRKEYAPVRTLFDRSQDDDLPPELLAAEAAPPSPSPLLPLLPRLQRVVAEPSPPPPASPPPAKRPAPVLAPVAPVLAPVAPTRPAAADRYWTAQVDGQQVVIAAPDIAAAARLAQAQGPVSSLERLQVL